MLSIIKSNMRLPEHRIGDLQAMIGTCKTAEQRLQQLIAKYGLAALLNCVTANLDRCEARMREKIQELPNGEYVHEDYLEYYDDGLFDPVLMRLSLTIDDDQVIANFAGSSDQVPGVVNSSLAVAAAGVFVALKSTLDPGGAVNEGVFRPIALRAPEGSIVNVRSDAPAGAHGEVRKRAVSVALGCLSQIVPELVSGDLCGTSFPNSIGGIGGVRKRPYVYYEVPAGGNGGFQEADGSSAFVNVDFGNIRSIHTAEHLESEMPLLVERTFLRTDSGGSGAHRGGLGMQREIRLLEREATYSVLSDRAVVPPFGVLGGGHGAPVGISVERDGKLTALDIPGKATGKKIRRGDVVVMQSAGGGGYGDPLSRDVGLVLNDVRAGYISVQGARDDYGVILSDELVLDDQATRKLRKKRETAAPQILVRADERDAYDGIRGRHRILRLHPDLAADLSLTDGQLVEAAGKHPTPLRAWIRVENGQPSDAIGLDEFACAVLGVNPGDHIQIRALPTLVRPGYEFTQ
jgi:N-methylhydantoinase B